MLSAGFVPDVFHPCLRYGDSITVRCSWIDVLRPRAWFPLSLFLSMAPAAPPGKPRCCLRAGERRQGSIPACRNGHPSLPAGLGMPACRQEAIPAGRDPCLPAGMDIHSCLQECRMRDAAFLPLHSPARSEHLRLSGGAAGAMDKRKAPRLRDLSDR